MPTSKPDLFLIVQSIIVLMFVGTCCLLFVNERPIPDLLSVTTSGITFYYIGARVSASVGKQAASTISAVINAVDGK